MTSALFDLTGRRAVATGASRGIGRAIVLAYAELGADVLAVARGQEGLAETARLAETLPGSVSTLAVDLSESAAAQAVVDEAVRSLGGIDVLVNNAGVFHAAPIEESRVEDWDSIHHVGGGGGVLLCRAASAYLEDSASYGPAHP